MNKVQRHINQPQAGRPSQPGMVMSRNFRIVNGYTEI